MKNEMTYPLQLDPCIAKQLDEQALLKSEQIQWYLDNPEQISTFMDFRVDYAFKYILGHKLILIKLLNDILPVEVSDIEYLPNEIPVISEKEKRAAFDVICTQRETGVKFLVEMQRQRDLDMDDRLLYYGSSLLHNQVRRGDKYYLLKPVYVICIADYLRQHDEYRIPEGKLLFHYSLTETEMGESFSGNRFHLFILELPRLQKVWELLDKNLERWCYLFENLHNFVHQPENSEGFDDLFKIAKTGQLEDRGLLNYLNSMVTEYEKYTIGEYARREGRSEMLQALREVGVSEALIEAALNKLKENAHKVKEQM